MPEPVAFYPLNARYKAAEKENRQPHGILGDVALTNGPYNEPGGAYMFYGNVRSYIEFPNKGGLDTQFSITLMCWVQPGGQDGPLFNYENFEAVLTLSGLFIRNIGFHMWIVGGNFLIKIEKYGSPLQPNSIRTPEVLPVGRWVHVAASYDHSKGSISLYLNGHLKASQNIDKDYRIATTTRKVRMGSTSGRDENFKGKIAEMEVYDVALNEAQIKTSIRQGNCTLSMIVVSLPSPIIPLIIETPVIEQRRKR